jgi:hypothetical protein
MMTPPASAENRLTSRQGRTRLAAVTAVAGAVSVLGAAWVTEGLPGSAHHGTPASTARSTGADPNSSGLPSSSSPGPAASGWLTSILRPAGTLDHRALSRLSQALDRLAASSDMVILDLTAVHVAVPRELARNLQTPALELDQPGRCLLLVGAPPDLVAELDHAAISVATLAAGSLPLAAI